MAVIKRYPNRKMYNTDAKQYITLDGIAEMIRNGEEVQVFDHSSGEDLTTLTLTQIILEQEKKNSGFLPRSVLTGLVQAGGDRLGSLRQALAAPLDILRHVDEEIERRIASLVKTGDLPAEEGTWLVEKLLNQAKRATRKTFPSAKQAENALKEQGTPTQQEIDQISAQLDLLAAKLERLSKQSSAED